MGVISGNRNADEVELTLINEDDGVSQYLYVGFDIDLFKNDLESYTANLRAHKPSVFVICEHGDEIEEIRLLVVTLSYDEMASYVEVDEPVFDIPIPSDIYHWVESYVLENYRPEERKKRRREKWADEFLKPSLRPLPDG